jgi:Flp pilus assembly protein TadG
MTSLGYSLARDRSGAAAIELALVLPFLLILMFGAVDVGDYYMSEHVVQKSVRDAARYAARLQLVQSDGTVNYSCSPLTLGTAAKQNIQHVARFGDPNGTSARLPGWTSDDMATVTLNCDSNTSDTYVNGGVYDGFPDGGAVPVITVSATVPYTTLFGALGVGATTWNLNAQSQAAVIGA